MAVGMNVSVNGFCLCVNPVIGWQPVHTVAFRLDQDGRLQPSCDTKSDKHLKKLMHGWTKKRNVEQVLQKKNTTFCRDTWLTLI